MMMMMKKKKVGKQGEQRDAGSLDGCGCGLQRASQSWSAS